MARMVNSEKEPIPTDENGETYFEMYIYENNRKKVFEILLRIPPFFQCEDGQIYNSVGLLVLPLKDLLEDYLVDCKNNGNPDSTEKLAAWFHEYADRLKSLHK